MLALFLRSSSSSILKSWIGVFCVLSSFCIVLSFRDERSEVEESKEVKLFILDSSLCSEWRVCCVVDSSAGTSEWRVCCEIESSLCSELRVGCCNQSPLPSASPPHWGVKLSSEFCSGWLQISPNPSLSRGEQKKQNYFPLIKGIRRSRGDLKKHKVLFIL